MKKLAAGVLLLVLGLGLAWSRLPQAPLSASQARLGVINGEEVATQELLDVSTLQLQVLYHELVLRQLILQKARPLAAVLPENPSRRELAQLLGKVLAGRLKADRRQHLEALCQEGAEQFELQVMLVSPEDADYVAAMVSPATFGESAEQFSKDDQSRFQRGRLGTLSAAEVAKKFGSSALAVCRSLELKAVSKPLKIAGGVLFLRVLARGRGKGQPLEDFLLTTEGWSTVESWVKDAAVQLPVYKYDEATMQSIFSLYLQARTSP